MNTLRTDEEYAKVHLTSPKLAMLNNMPLDSSEQTAKMGSAGTVLGILGPGIGAISGGATGALIGSLGVLGTSALISKYAKTNEIKGFGAGLEIPAAVGAITSTAALTGLLTAPVWGVMLLTFGGVMSFNILYYLLTGKKAKALQIIEDKVGKENVDKYLGKIEDGVNEIKEKITGEDKKNIIKV